MKKPKSPVNVVLTFLFLFAAILALIWPALTAWLGVAERQIIDYAFVASFILTPAIAYFKPNWKIALSLLVLWTALRTNVAPLTMSPVSYPAGMHIETAGFPYVFFHHVYDRSYSASEIGVSALVLDILVVYLAYLMPVCFWEGRRKITT